MTPPSADRPRPGPAPTATAPASDTDEGSNGTRIAEIPTTTYSVGPTPPLRYRPVVAQQPAQRISMPRRSRAVGPLVALVGVGLLLGAFVGALFGVLAPPTKSAAALLQLSPETVPALAALQGAQQSDQDLAQFTSGELAYLSGDGLKRELEARIGGAIDFSAAEEPQTSVVRLTATSTNQADAIRVVQTALDLYSQRRVADSARLTDQALAAVDRALADANRPDAPPDPGAAARIDRLQTLRLDIVLQADKGVLDIIEPPAAVAPSGAPMWLLPTVLGALVGALVVAVAVVGRRALSSKVETGDEVENIVDRVLQPDVRIGPNLARSAAIEGQAVVDRKSARLITAQIFGGQTVTGRIVVAAGVSPRSGTGTIASLIAAGASDLGPTVLIRLGTSLPRPSDPDEGARLLPDGSTITGESSDPLQIVDVPPDQPGLEIGSQRFREVVGASRRANPCVVLDAGPITDSPELLRTLSAASDVVLVMRLGVDDLSDVGSIAAAAGAGPGRLSAALTRMAWYAPLLRGQRHA